MSRRRTDASSAHDGPGGRTDVPVDVADRIRGLVRDTLCVVHDHDPDAGRDVLLIGFPRANPPVVWGLDLVDPGMPSVRIVPGPGRTTARVTLRTWVGYDDGNPLEPPVTYACAWDDVDVAVRSWYFYL